MSNVLATSVIELEEIEALLKKDIPNYRQAYSDRTSWIMACLSELAYLRFNRSIVDTSSSKLVDKVSKLIDDNKLSSLNKLIDFLAYDSEEEKKMLISDLELLDMKVEKLFDTKGTQAIMVSNKKFHVLAFRGTESSSMADIKADLKAKTMACETGGKIHTGFNDAFAAVHIEIQEYIDTLEDGKPLFITGHSLGGALATVATKKLTYKHGIAACYTYGSPRVGDEKWMEDIKTSIYRVVNSADPVTMLPPGDEVVSVLAWLIKWVPYVGQTFSTQLLSNFSGYSHLGYMRYLTNVDKGDYKSARLLYAVTFYRRIKAYLLKKASFMKIGGDHSITVYRKKLKCVALGRNIKKEN